MSISKIFIPNFVRVLTNKRKYILNRIFILLLGSCPRGGTWGTGVSKTLAWGFAMAPHRLRILVLNIPLQWNILVSVRPNYLIFMGYFKNWSGLGGFKQIPWTPSVSATESHVLARVIFRIESLESTLQEKEKQLSEEREKFQKLKEDFKYNLRLLGERDQELDRYDTTFAGKILGPDLLRKFY